MKIQYYFLEGQFIKRINRFVILVKLNNRMITAHLPDPGRLKNLLITGNKVLLKKESKISRKTNFTAQAIYSNKILISLNTLIANTLVSYLIINKSLSFLNSWNINKQEIKIDSNRFDFELINNCEKMIVEVKSTTLSEYETAMFPDAVTARGAKHVSALGKLAKNGLKTMLLFVVQREDISNFRLNWKIDERFCSNLLQAYQQGLQIKAIKIKMTKKNYLFKGEIPINLNKKI